MGLAPGTRLGPYEVVSALGEGGMGEVYRATDTKLNRDVALKILPATFITEPDRLARFRREAHVLASLNHPNIGHIYGFEDSGATQALVLELVDGPTLADRIAQGPLALADALPIARQIADALEAAHEQGIVHRDLKPANVKVRADGTVKVLDFGLAKALDTDPAAASGSAMNSPTLTARGTQMGVILGTAAYMAPEQAKGRAVDRRADIWAFGVVLYEMVTGRRLFDAEDVSETLAAVLTRDVSAPVLAADLPPRLRTLLRDCLVRDPKQRLRDIGDARLVLDRIIAGAPSEDGVVTPASLVAASDVPAWRRALPWTIAGGLGAALVSALLMWSPWRPGPPAPMPRKLLASIGADASLVTDRGAAAILSPDGTTLAFVAQQGGSSRLFIRKLDQLQAVPLVGTDEAAYPFFSPDGQWVAFFANGKVKKVAVTGGAALTLCDAASGRGGTWADDDTIIFSPTGGTQNPLLRVPAAGGTPAVFGALSEGATTQRWPQALPGGKAVLFTEHSSATAFDGANVVVAPLPELRGDLSAATPAAARVVVPGAYYGRYVSSGPGAPARGEREGGHLVYIQTGALFAVPFDPVRLEVTGPAVPVLDGLTSSVGSGGAQVAVSSEGTLAYVPGETAGTAVRIDWLTRDGSASVLRAANPDWIAPRFSPDGQKLAMAIYDGKQRDIWVLDVARDTLTQLTFDAGSDQVPIWTPDGRHIVFASDRAKPGTHNLYWVNADGTGDATRLTDSPDDQRPASWHADGRFLGFHANRAGTSHDLMVLPMDGDAARGWTPGTPTVFLSTPASEVFPMFSPDGRFIAYFSTEAGDRTYDVYVRQFPGPGGKWRVTTGGGIFPRWSAAGRELLFLTAEKIMSAPYAVSGGSFVPDKPQLWSPTSIRLFGTNSPYDVHPDGTRVAAAAAQQPGAVQDKVVFVFNFAGYLRTIAPAKK